MNRRVFTRRSAYNLVQAEQIPSGIFLERSAIIGVERILGTDMFGAPLVVVEGYALDLATKEHPELVQTIQELRLLRVTHESFAGVVRHAIQDSVGPLGKRLEVEEPVAS